MGRIRIDRVGGEQILDLLPLPARLRGAVVLAAVMAAACCFAASAAALPEGRAYEMVSKPEKENKDLNQENYEVSPDGETAAYSSSAAIGDPEGGGYQNQFVASREGPTWSFQAISAKSVPNPGQYSARIVGFSEDLRYHVIRTNAALTPEATERVENLYIRDRLTGETTLVSPGATQTGPNDYVEFVAGSEDLSTIFFEKDEALLPGASETVNNIYEWSEGELRLASVMPDGLPSTTPARVGFNDAYENESVSDDGSRMYFTVNSRLYLREDRQPAILVSKTEAGVDAAGTLLSATPNGRYAFFTSNIALRSTDTNVQQDLYRFDAVSGVVEHLSIDSEPVDGVSPNVAAGYIGASESGNRIYFMATGQIVAGAPTAPARKLYLWEEGVGVRYVTELSTADPGVNGITSALRGVEKVSADGRFAVISSTLPLTGYANANVRQYFRYDADAEELVCVSCDPDGSAPVGPAKLMSEETTFKYLKENVRIVSDDGRVLFHTPQALVNSDTNERVDAYVWTGSAAELVSSGGSSTPSFSIAITADGRDVFFLTREQLVGWDNDEALDLYDARIGGGFPEPPDPVPPCQESSCKPQPSLGPPPLTPGTSDFRGSGDARPESTKRLRLLQVSGAQARAFARGGRLPLRVHVPKAGKVRAVARAGGGKVAAVTKRVGEPGRTRLVLRPTKSGRKLLAAASQIQIEVRMGSSIATTTVKTGR